MFETVQFNAKNAPFCFLFFIKFFRGGVPLYLPSRLGASRRRSSDNTDKICSGLAPLYIWGYVVMHVYLHVYVGCV